MEMELDPVLKLPASNNIQNPICKYLSLTLGAVRDETYIPAAFEHANAAITGKPTVPLDACVTNAPTACANVHVYKTCCNYLMLCQVSVCS